LTRNADGSYSGQGSSPDYQVRDEMWSPAYSTTAQRIAAKWLNCEETVYVKAEDEFVDGTYLFQLKTRTGHHSSSGDHCQGAALIGRLWRRQTNGWLSAGFAKEICHSAYTTSPSNQGVVTTNTVPHTGTDFYNKWIGLKHIVYNIVESGNTYTKQELWADIDVQDNNGNLVINNNWKLLTTYIDRGGWCTSQSAYDADCDGCTNTRCQILTGPGGNTTSGSANFNRNETCIRTDGIRFRFMQMTVREIDSARPASGDPAPPPSTDPASAFDSFGVRKVYASKTGGGGNEWYIASTPTSDSRFNANVTVSKNADGTYKIQNSIISQYLLNVYQPNGYNSGVTATNAQNHGTCAQRGYMQDPSDWRNVEMTAYFNPITEAGAGAGEIVLFARGGRHVDPQPNCEGSSMKGFMATSGATRFAKEQYHIAYHYTAYSNQINSSILNRWIGIKYVCYNRNVAGTNVVKQEIYVDNDNSNTWVKVDERSDTGGWGINGRTPCNGFSDDQQIIWGGPIATFRMDNFTNLNFKFLSVREIDADAISQDPPPDQPVGSCGT